MYTAGTSCTGTPASEVSAQQQTHLNHGFSEQLIPPLSVLPTDSQLEVMLFTRQTTWRSAAATTAAAAGHSLCGRLPDFDGAAQTQRR